MRKLRDKAAIVAGAAPGNTDGATANRLAQEGMKVIVPELNAAAAQVVVDEITSSGGYAVARGSNVTEESDSKGREDFSTLFPGFGAASD